MNITSVEEELAERRRIDLYPNISKLTPEQMEMYTQSFQLYDTEWDGRIHTKFVGELLRRLGRNVSEEKVQKLIKQYGVADSLELCSFLDLMARDDMQVLTDEIYHALKSIEQVNGKILVKDLRLALKSFGKRFSDKEIDKLLSYLYVQDGSILVDEFVQIFQG